jgi:hypothetical protein
MPLVKIFWQKKSQVYQVFPKKRLRKIFENFLKKKKIFSGIFWNLAGIFRIWPCFFLSPAKFSAGNHSTFQRSKKKINFSGELIKFSGEIKIPAKF